MSVENVPSDFPPLASEDMGDESDDRMRRIVALLLLLAIIGLVVWWFLSRLILVPDVVGLTESKARETLEVAGFELGEITTTTVSIEEEAGKITDQNPDAGNRVLKGSGIDVVIAVLPGTGSGDGSSGFGGTGAGTGGLPRSVAATDQPIDYVPYVTDPILSGPQVPMVLNMTLANAKATLSSAGYKYTVKYGPSTAGVVKGHVLYQKPEPDAFEDRGTVVEIWISTGAPKGGAPYPQPD